MVFFLPAEATSSMKWFTACSQPFIIASATCSSGIKLLEAILLSLDRRLLTSPCPRAACSARYSIRCHPCWYSTFPVLLAQSRPAVRNTCSRPYPTLWFCTLQFHISYLMPLFYNRLGSPSSYLGPRRSKEQWTVYMYRANRSGQARMGPIVNARPWPAPG